MDLGLTGKASSGGLYNDEACFDVRLYRIPLKTCILRIICNEAIGRVQNLFVSIVNEVTEQIYPSNIATT